MSRTVVKQNALSLHKNLQDQADALSRSQFIPSISASLDSSSALTLTSTSQPIPGLSFEVVIAGTYVIVGTFDFAATTTGWNTAVGVMEQNGGAHGAQAILGDNGAATQRATVSQSWLIPASENDSIFLSAYILGAGGTIQASSPSTSMRLFRIT